MINDPIGDMLVRIKNGYMARRQIVQIPYSNVKAALGQLLVKHGYIGKIETDSLKKQIQIELLYRQEQPALTVVKRLSKPGLRRYVKVRDIRSFRQGLGHIILSTPKGLKTHVEAKKEAVGGEVLCSIW